MVEKIPCGENPFTLDQSEPPVRFYEYPPWDSENLKVIDENSRFQRLTHADNLAIRLKDF